MKPKKKILILLPDGVGLRNFAFTSFVEIGEQMGWEVIFWNHTPFDLEELGYKEIKLRGNAQALTDLLKRAKNEAELNHFTKKFDDPVYQTYKFPASKISVKDRIKNWIISALVCTHKGEKGLQWLRNKMKTVERKGEYYKNCKAILKKEKPDLVFCTNQRPVHAIAPITAAQDLKIPTATFIFSWDNLPKATMVVEPAHYFVWSKYMERELLNYYPRIKPDQIFITGSPQFEPHYDLSLRQSKGDFFKKHGLDVSKNYICFSGDDVTTSPHDEIYLKDVAEAVEGLNIKGEKIGIIFRRSPADFSNRYDPVLKKYKDIIVPIAPLWERIGKEWNHLLPTKADLQLQSEIIQNTFMVINVGSSMVFDYIIYQKPCAYINYNPRDVKIQKDIHEIYNYAHFKSMPSKNAVLWINDENEIKEKILQVINGDVSQILKDSNKWFHRINYSPGAKTSQTIWEIIDEIVRKTK